MLLLDGRELQGGKLLFASRHAAVDCFVKIARRDVSLFFSNKLLCSSIVLACAIGGTV